MLLCAGKVKNIIQLILGPAFWCDDFSISHIHRLLDDVDPPLVLLQDLVVPQVVHCAWLDVINSN